MSLSLALYEELSSSEEESSTPRVRSSRNRTRGPSIHDGPQAIARFKVGSKHGTRLLLEPFITTVVSVWFNPVCSCPAEVPVTPPGYVTFRDVGDQNEGICNRDVTSPINELDRQSNSSRGDLILRLCEF